MLPMLPTCALYGNESKRVQALKLLACGVSHGHANAASGHAITQH